MEALIVPDLGLEEVADLAGEGALVELGQIEGLLLHLAGNGNGDDHIFFSGLHSIPPFAHHIILNHSSQLYINLCEESL